MKIFKTGLINSVQQKLRVLERQVNRKISGDKRDVIEKLQSLDKYQEPKSLIPFGYKVYSQNEEDGIIREIFNRIGTTNKVFVEFGIGDGLENNTVTLLFYGWRGLWIEGNSANVNKIEIGLANTIKSQRLTIINSFITKENIDSLIASAIKESEIDLISVDVDGNDYHFFESISCINPRVVIIEYNAKFSPPLKYCMKYNPNHSWDGTDNFGVSLKFLELKLREKGYALVACNLTGSNAFFVRQDLVEDKFLAPFTAEKHYQPPRYHIAGMQSGHQPSYKTLDNWILSGLTWEDNNQEV